jgi:hypothetical protein
MSNSVFDPSQEALEPAVQTFRKRFRWKTGLALFAVGAIGTVILNRSAASDTHRIIRTYEGVGITLVALIVWWVFFSGVRFWTRLVCLLLVGLTIVGGAIMSVRNVEFTGDMRPIFWFVWDAPSPSEKAQDWLNEHAPQSNVAAVPEMPDNQTSENTGKRD